MNKRKMIERRMNEGFTLVEMLLVLTIIGVLAAAVLMRFAGQGQNAKITATRLSIQNICTAIDIYETENGRFPSSLQDLTVETEDHAAPLDEVPVDAWGNQFQFAKVSKFKYQITSSGPDGQSGTEDDITN
jgi:general secretion pathway protein G